MKFERFPYVEGKLDRYVFTAGVFSLLLVIWNIASPSFHVSDVFVLFSQLVLCVLYFYTRKHTEEEILKENDIEHPVKFPYVVGSCVIFSFCLIVITSAIGFIF